MTEMIQSIKALYGGYSMDDIQAALDDGLITPREAQDLADRIPMPEPALVRSFTPGWRGPTEEQQRVSAIMRTMTKDAWGDSEMTARNQFISVFNHSPRAVVALANGYRAIA